MALVGTVLAEQSVPETLVLWRLVRVVKAGPGVRSNVDRASGNAGPFKL
jgi:hypothetical protein